MDARFLVGDRVKIRRSWSEVDGAVGTVAEPPDNIRKQAGFGSAHFRKETTLTGSQTTVYWIEFDALGASGTTEAGEFDETELDKL